MPLGCTTELSHKGQEFLTLLFMQHDRDRDGALSPIEMESLFSRCNVPPWSDEYKYTVPTNEKVFTFALFTSRISNCTITRRHISTNLYDTSIDEEDTPV